MGARGSFHQHHHKRCRPLLRLWWCYDIGACCTCSTIFYARSSAPAGQGNAYRSLGNGAQGLFVDLLLQVDGTPRAFSCRACSSSQHHRGACARPLTCKWCTTWSTDDPPDTPDMSRWYPCYEHPRLTRKQSFIREKGEAYRRTLQQVHQLMRQRRDGQLRPPPHQQ
jgi:hypothetical protein